MEVIGYLATLVMGLVLGVMGGGGSILTVPILVYLFQVLPVQATAYSLFIVGLTSAIGFVSYYKRGDVDLKVGTIFAIPAFVGVFAARAWIVPALPEAIGTIGTLVITKNILIMLTFAVLMVLAAFSMIKSRPVNLGPADKKPRNYPLIALEGLGVGAITGFVGAGGGFLIIPALVILGGLSMRLAVGTSLMIIAAKSLTGFVGDMLKTPDLDWSLMITLSLISIVGIFIGSKLSGRIPEKGLKTAFGYFVLGMGTLILVEQFTRLS